jgi:hypothetical protein
MARLSLHKILFIGLFCCSVMATAAENDDAGTSPWRFNAGVSVGKVSPLMISAGMGYKSILFHVEGLGAHNGDNDYWCGMRGGIDWTFFWNRPFSIDAGFNGGYEYAEAPNKMHQAVNRANDAMILLPYDYVETLDISAELRIHLYGFYTQIDYPIHHFMNHDEPKFNWRIGYLVEF